MLNRGNSYMNLATINQAITTNKEIKQLEIAKMTDKCQNKGRYHLMYCT